MQPEVKENKEVKEEQKKFIRPNNDSLMAKIQKHSDITKSGCNIWLGTMRRYGVEHGNDVNSAGIIYINKERVNVHEIVWQAMRGEIPKNHLVVKTCKNERCFNINHLMLKNMALVAVEEALVTNQYGLTEKETLQVRKSPELYTVFAKRYGITQSTIKAIKAELSMTAKAR